MSGRRPAASHKLIVYTAYEAADERRRESLLALGNGVLLVRGTAPEAESGEHHYPGIYRAGCYDRLVTQVDDRRVENESIVNLPNCLPLSFRIAGEGQWLSLEDVTLLEYQHGLDLENGFTFRHVRFHDGAGRHTRLDERRIVSMATPHLVAVRWDITPEDWSGSVEIRSAIDGRIENANVARYRRFDGRHLESDSVKAIDEDGLLLAVHTRQSRIQVAVAARTSVSGAEQPSRATELGKAHAADFRIIRVDAGRSFTVEKIGACITSRDPAVSGCAEAAIAALRSAPDFDSLEAAHAEAWARSWCRGRIDVRRPDLSEALAFHRFHILQTVSPHSADLDVGFPARGWQEAYHGQIFWDEIFVYPFLNLRFPEIARSLLLYRFRRLDAARQAARESGYRGAMFPWRSAGTGREATPSHQFSLLSGRWMPDHTHLQRHVGAAIAFNVWHYFLATGDVDFLADHGAEMVIEIARFWASIAQPDPADDRYDIRGVIGPDEYHNLYPGASSPGLDNNAYTNVMAAWTLRRAAELMDHLPSHRRAEIGQQLRLRAEEIGSWRHIARRMRLVFHDDGVISQFEGFDRLAELDIDATRATEPGWRLDWILEARGDLVDAHQVTKQADVLMLMHLLPGEELTEMAAHMGYDVPREALRRTAEYYLQRISHESSLSRIVCAGALAELDTDRSRDMFLEALYPDRNPPSGSNTEEGLHLGAMAGTIDVLQRLYLGIRPDARALTIRPALPGGLGPLRMELSWCRLEFEVETTSAGIVIRAGSGNGAQLPIVHRGGLQNLAPGASFEVPH